jgi:hypothetical protein
MPFVQSSALSHQPLLSWFPEIFDKIRPESSKLLQGAARIDQEFEVLIYTTILFT